jgi:hypothetical protein
LGNILKRTLGTRTINNQGTRSPYNTMSFKTLHQFTVHLDQEVDIVEERIENGQPIKVSRKDVKPVPHVIVLKEPTRREKQELSMFHGKCMTEAVVKHGLAPRMLLIQKFSRDPDSPLSQDEDKNLAKMYDKMQELQNDLVRVKTLPEDSDTKEKTESLWLETQIMRKKIMDIESSYASLFAHCAENYSQNRSITWLVLNMSYLEKAGAPNNKEVLFMGKTFDEREDYMYGLEERDDKLYAACMEKLSTYWALYFLGHAANTEDFKKLEEEMGKQLAASEKASKAKDEEEEVKKEEPVPPTIDSLTAQKDALIVEKLTGEPAAPTA